MRISRTAAGALVMLIAAPGGIALAASPPPPPPPQQFAAGVQTGTIQNSVVTEASGIAASRANPNVLWTHNDSGHPAQVFPMTTAGTNLGTYTISGAGSTDWEDIAVGPGPLFGQQYLYIADIGDNGGPNDTPTRASISVYRVPEPAVSDTQAPATVTLSGAARFNFTYPDGMRDAESMFVDPATRDIYIISKRDTLKHLYRATYPQSTANTTMLEHLLDFPTDSTWLTAADISPDGNEIIVRSTATTSGRLYLRPPGGTIADAFNTTPYTIPLHAETQGEAIGFAADGRSYFTTSEGLNPPIYFFQAIPEPAGMSLVMAAGVTLFGRRRARSANRAATG